MREASLEDLSKELTDINKIGGQLRKDVKSVQNDLSSWTTPPERSGNIMDDPKPDEIASAPSEPPTDPGPPNDNP
jgi:hypothetical protein